LSLKSLIESKENGVGEKAALLATQLLAMQLLATQRDIASLDVLIFKIVCRTTFT